MPPLRGIMGVHVYATYREASPISQKPIPIPIFFEMGSLPKLFLVPLVLSVVQG